MIVHPSMRQVLPLAPEPIQNTDGSKKQDCEINAGKRLVANMRKRHPKLPIIVTGDGLYQSCRDKISSRKEYFSLLRHMFQMVLFRDWQHMLNFIHAPPDLYAP